MSTCLLSIHLTLNKNKGRFVLEELTDLFLTDMAARQKFYPFVFAPPPRTASLQPSRRTIFSQDCVIHQNFVGFCVETLLRRGSAMLLQNTTIWTTVPAKLTKLVKCVL